ncbi:MAG: hypothetical protein GY809_03965 [Planctomycetes bacterium]|nr:hypothetical protein [Planctomycetota bacterium]
MDVTLSLGLGHVVVDGVEVGDAVKDGEGLRIPAPKSFHHHWTEVRACFVTDGLGALFVCLGVFPGPRAWLIILRKCFVGRLQRVSDSKVEGKGFAKGEVGEVDVAYAESGANCGLSLWL